jgi:hypothetical protein
MEIVMQGQHNGMEAIAALHSVMKLLKEYYAVQLFREIHLSLTLVDEVGQEIELVDQDTNQVYGLIEIHREPAPYRPSVRSSGLKLVVDNTEKS